MASRIKTKKKFYRSTPKSGTTHFHAYATAVVVHKGHRYTLALFHVEYGEKIKDVVQRLMKIIRSRGVKVRYLLLDKGFFSVEVITYLKRAQLGFIIPAMVRGRKPKGRKKATGLRAIRKKKNGYYHHTLKGKVGGKQRSSPVTICVASKSYTHKKTGKRRTKKLMYVVSKVRLTPREIREMYRTRFGIETSYRQMHEARIKTVHARPTAAVVVYRYCASAAKRVGVVALQASEEEMERGAAVISRTAPLPRNAALDRSRCRTDSPRR